MIKNKGYILKLLISMVLVPLLLLAFSACEGNEETSETQACTSHVDADGNAKCDKCGEVVETEGCTDHIDVNGDNKCEICGATVVQPIKFTVTLKDEKGDAVSDISVSIKYGNEETANGLTDENGVFGGEILPDKYTVFFDGIPEGWVISGNGSYFEFKEDGASFEFTAVDNNPDGSEEKPYYIGDMSVTTVFEAGKTYHYHVKGATDSYLVINNENVKVTYNSVDYLPENGVLRVLIKGTGDTNSSVPFTITNTSSGVNEVIAALAAIPGSQGAPYDAVIGENTVTVKKDSTVYHKIIAPSNGYLILNCADAANHIMMQNTTSSVVTKYTDGGSTLNLPVNKGDVIFVLVAARSADDLHELKFSLKMCEATALDPLEITGSCILRLPTRGGVVLSCASDIAILTVSATGVTITDASGNALSPVDGKYVIEIKEGELYTLSNTTGIPTDADIKVTEKEITE